MERLLPRGRGWEERASSRNTSERHAAEIRASLTILSGGGLLSTRHSSLPLECLTACCVASAVMIGGPYVENNSRQRETRKEMEGGEKRKRDIF